LAEPLIGTIPSRRGPWISTLVAAAERTVTVPVHIDPSLVRRSRYSSASLWKLFRQRTRLFVLRRIVIFTVAALVVALGMARVSAQAGGIVGAAIAIMAGLSLLAAIFGVALTFVSLAERHRD
jgi:hypothetical protein